MSDDDRSMSRNAGTIENIDRWKRAMDGIAATFVGAGINPAEALFIMAKCIGHALQEVPEPNEREQMLENLVNIIRRVMHHTDAAARKTFMWN